MPLVILPIVNNIHAVGKRTDLTDRELIRRDINNDFAIVIKAVRFPSKPSAEMAGNRYQPFCAFRKEVLRNMFVFFIASSATVSAV